MKLLVTLFRSYPGQSAVMLVALLFLAGGQAFGRGVTRRVRGYAAQ